jgi:hypothetical protein
MTTDHIPFYINASFEACFEFTQQNIKWAITAPLQPPTPSETYFQQLSHRITLLALSILILSPIFLLGIAVERTCSFIAHHSYKPVVACPSLDQQTTNPLQSFPSETQALVLQNVDPQELISLSQTCKKWRQHILYTLLPFYINATHSPLYLFNFQPIFLDHILKHIGKKITYLKLEKVTCKVAYHWASFCPNLSHLTIDTLTNPLKSMVAYWVPHTYWFCPLVEQRILKTEKLQYLSLPDCQLRPHEAEKIATFTNLTRLNLFGNNSMGEGLFALTKLSQAEESTQPFPKLTYLNLGLTHPKESIYSKLSIFANITEFHYDGNVFRSDQAFSTFIGTLQKFLNLKKLSLRRCNIDDTKAQLIYENLPNLVELNIEKNTITCPKLISIIQSLKQLRELSTSILTIASEEIPTLINALIDYGNFSKFRCQFSTPLTDEAIETLEAQSILLKEKFPDSLCITNTKFIFFLN